MSQQYLILPQCAGIWFGSIELLRRCRLAQEKGGCVGEGGGGLGGGGEGGGEGDDIAQAAVAGAQDHTRRPRTRGLLQSCGWTTAASGKRAGASDFGGVRGDTQPIFYAVGHSNRPHKN